MPPIFTEHPLESLLVVSAFLFCAGVFTIITRRNAVSILMGVELVLNAANLNFIAFAQFSGYRINGPTSEGWYQSTMADTPFEIRDISTTSIRFVQNVKTGKGSELVELEAFEFVDGAPVKVKPSTSSVSDELRLNSAESLRDGERPDAKTWRSKEEAGLHWASISWSEPRSIRKVRAIFDKGWYAEDFRFEYFDAGGWKPVTVTSTPEGSGVHGFTFVLFVILLAAAEAAVALAIIIGIYQNFGKIDVDKATMLKE
jgi:NADH:ubiquinone oxidoreductase subunit K